MLLWHYFRYQVLFHKWRNNWRRRLDEYMLNLQWLDWRIQIWLCNVPAMYSGTALYFQVMEIRWSKHIMEILTFLRICRHTITFLHHKIGGTVSDRGRHFFQSIFSVSIFQKAFHTYWCSLLHLLSRAMTGCLSLNIAHLLMEVNHITFICSALQCMCSYNVLECMYAISLLFCGHTT